ncbi:MAG: hypothetical protein SGI87_10920 [Flavobacteriales bacterium]|nr:hypothetical protein [Flavobacteriales bacterium]
MRDFIGNWKLVGIMCLTLGLAPFTPEPHIWGKIKWIAGGANDMQLLDWWDFVMHGTPWFLLIRIGFLALKKKFQTAS